MTHDSIEPKGENVSKDTDFCPLPDLYLTNREKKYWILLLNLH